MAYRALLIEDNPDHALLAKRAMLKDERIASVDVCATALEALDFLEDDSRQRPDLILVDIRLPGISGLEFVRRAKGRSESAEIPIVILSTAASESDVRQGIDLGACAVISKPLRVEDLMNRLAAAGSVAPDLVVSENGAAANRQGRNTRSALPKLECEPEGRAP